MSAGRLLILLVHVGIVVCVHERLKRFLLFPRANPTRLQLIAGIGLPVDLQLESITVGYVLKAEYFLPYNVSHFKPAYVDGFGERRRMARAPQPPTFKSLFDELDDGRQAIEALARSDEDMEPPTGNSLKSSRWNLYEAFEMALNSQGYSGRTCLLRTICEAAAHPFVMGADDSLLEEILHILFTPSSSADKLSHHMDNEYYRAEQLGRTHAPCDRIFEQCPVSPMDRFSTLLHDDD